MIKGFFTNLRDFIEIFFNEDAVMRRRVRKPRGLQADDWSYQR